MHNISAVPPRRLHASSYPAKLPFRYHLPADIITLLTLVGLCFTIHCSFMIVPMITSYMLSFAVFIDAVHFDC